MNGAVPALAVLLACSAFLAASETAFVSLVDATRERAGDRVRALWRDPKALLGTLLASSFVVDLLFFATASRFLEGSPRDLLVALAALLARTVLGGLLPRILALRWPAQIARAGAPLLAPLVACTAPARRAARVALEVCMRALGPFAREEPGVQAEQLAALVETSAHGGALESAEADLVAEILELDGIRVREIMTPRVDVLTLDLDDADDERLWFVIARALARRLTWLPVVRGHADDVAGCVRLREVLASPERSIAQLLRPVQFVPAVASALDLLHVLRDARATEAVVVDEHGGTAGIVTIEDVFEEIVGDLRVEGERDAPLVSKLEDGRLRVFGGLSIRDWNERSGRAIVPVGFETVGGFVAALLGRVPRVGDRVQTAELVAEVREVRGRRVAVVDLWPLEESGGAA